MDALRRYLIALQFFTRVPVTGRLADWVGFSPELLRRSVVHFPGVGLLVGLVAAFTYAALQELLPDSGYTPLVAAVLSTATTVWMTGGFHEDGLADLTDGLGGSADRERALDIMKDSRIGSFGALSLILALLAKTGLLALLGDVDPDLAPAVLVFGHVASRWMPLWIIRLLPHVGDTARSKSKPLADQITNAGLAIATLWLAIAGALVFWWWTDARMWGAGLLMAAIACWRMAARLQRRLQGYTGDGLGATQQLSEIGVYLGVALACTSGG